MLQTRLISPMKYQKDRMDNFLPVAEMNQLLAIYKDVGATHVEVSTVIGHPNFIAYSKQWADAIHALGMNVTWRNAHINMEGLYNQPKFTGGNRKPAQFWIDEAKNAATALGTAIKAGDEWAIYPERTEGIFSDGTAFLWEGLPGSYAEFFINMNEACKTVLPTGVKLGRSANNGSELMNGWMPASLINYAGMVVVDHYRDGNTDAYYDDIVAMSNRYGKPVYVQEGSPHRFTAPTRAEADAYYAVNKQLVDEGKLVGFGSWSGWSGTPESIINWVNGTFMLNENGAALKAWWTGEPSVPPVEPPPVEPPPTDGDFEQKLAQLSTLLTEYSTLKVRIAEAELSLENATAITENKRLEIVALLNEILAEI